MIYKPTDLSPSAQTFDVMDTPIFFECKVDTSNVQASGFTIEILDSENSVVFSSIPEGEQLNINYITIIDDLREYVHTYFSDYEDGYSLLNTGYNGSYLKFPFSVAYSSRANNTSAINQIFYIPPTETLPSGVDRSESGLYRNNYKLNGNNYEIDSSKPLNSVNIYNGKEYKWSITLYQLENVGTTKNPVWKLPENPLMFDMPVTTGTVLGSNNKRIQSAFSEEIYGDYFIQPLKIENLSYSHDNLKSWYYSGSIKQIGSRTMIKSYDMSFGYIYPMEGDNGIPEANIMPDQANAFRIYKNGNSPENLTAYQKVNFVANKSLDSYIASEWNNNTSYTPGDIVLYNNNIYQCVLECDIDEISTIPGKNNIYWEKVSEDKVESWSDGKTLTYCSFNHNIYGRSTDIPYVAPAIEYNAGIVYEAGDVVYFDSDKNDNKTEKYYQCKKTVTAIQPSSNTEYWEEITAFWSDNNVGDISSYADTKNYVKGNVVESEGKYYAYINESGSKGNKPTDKNYWAEIPVFNWYSNYSIDNVVIYKDEKRNITGAYKCIRSINQTPINGSNFWSLISYKNIDYQEGSVVGYVDYLYRCKKSYSINDPTLNPIPSLYGQYNESSNPNGSLYWSLYNGQVWEWTSSLANPEESYGTFTYYSNTKPNGMYTLPDNIMPTSLTGGERIVLNDQETDAVFDNGEYLGSPYNGIYNVDISSQMSSEEYKSENTYLEGDIITYNGYEYYCTGVVMGSQPGVSSNWSKYWMGTQAGSNATNYDASKSYKKGDIVQIEVSSDESSKIYSYYTCLGVVSGQTPPSDGESSIYWVKNNRNGYRVTIRFNRVPDADSWGELMTKIVYVSSGNQFYGKNIQIKSPNEDGTINTSDGYGVINQTPFKFIEEEPIEIYKYEPSVANPYRNTIGLILYNNPVTASNKNGILYIRYFEGIQKGMMLQKLSNDNKYQYFIIDDVGTNGGMYLKYHEVKEFDTYKSYTISNTVTNANPTKLTTDTTWDIDETKYQIKTYFRESDENAFYFYSRPEIDVQFENSIGVNFVTGTTQLVDADKWEDGKIYGIGDYVYIDDNSKRTYYECIANNTTSNPAASSASGWDKLDSGDNIYNREANYTKNTIVSSGGVYYIALTNITQKKTDGAVTSIEPSGENLGIFWEVYYGTLYEEDLGFKYSLYNDLKAYKKGDIVFSKGIYYIVIKDILSENPEENENLWKKFTDIKDDVIYNVDNIGYYEGKCYKCIVNDTNGYENHPSNWILYDDYLGDEQYKNGLRVINGMIDAIGDNLYTDFNEEEVYTIERTVFYNGERYQVVVQDYVPDKQYKYKSGDYVIYNSEYYCCIKDTDGNIAPNNNEYWKLVDVVITSPLLFDTSYYVHYDSWSKDILYNEGDIVLYNNELYVYINDNRNKKNAYREDIEYKIGDIAKIPDSNGVYRWMYCIKNTTGTITDAIIDECWTEIKPDLLIGNNGNYTYNYNDFWVLYYGFLYEGNYLENLKTTNEDDEDDSYLNYFYNNVVYYNGQYYQYVNPNLDGVSTEEFRGNEINTSLKRINTLIPKYKTGSPGYDVNDIVIYDNKYYICYNPTTLEHYSPANKSYWALFPWQIFITEINERTVVCHADYNQQQYIQWKSVQWFLYNEHGDVLDKSEVIYDGNLKYTFHGIDGREKGKQDQVFFTIKLILETQTGYRISISKKIEAIYEIEEIDSKGLIDAYFDCDTMSIVSVITKESGFIVPTIDQGSIVSYSEGKTNGEMTIDGQIDYSKVLYSLESASSIASASDIISDAKRFVLNSSHEIDTDYFSGYLVRVQTSVDKKDGDWDTQGEFGIYLQQMLSDTKFVESNDDFYNGKEIITLNENRNTLYWEAEDINSGSSFYSTVKLVENSSEPGGAIILSDKGDLTKAFSNSMFETVSNYQPNGFFDVFNLTKDDSYYPNKNYLPITYAAYLDEHGEKHTNDKYNVEAPYNVYSKYTFSRGINASQQNIEALSIKRVQTPILSANQFTTNVTNDANIFELNAFIVTNDNSENASTELYLAEESPTLMSDYSYSETYGVIEGLRYVENKPYVYYRQKNVTNDYILELDIWKESADNELELRSWKDGDFIKNSNYFVNKAILGSVSINGVVSDSIYMKKKDSDDVDNSEDIEISNSNLFMQERFAKPNENIIMERSYLNGKTLIVDAELVMDGNGGLTPYPGDTDDAQKVVVYVNSNL